MISIAKFSFFTVIFIILFKLLFFILVKNDLIIINLGGGIDSVYYDDYALGQVNNATSTWPVILRYFNDLGIYSREFISYIFLFLNIFYIPKLTCKLASLDFRKNQKHYLYIFLLCIIYPTMFFFTFDIYRDIFMVLVFLIGCLFVKNSLESTGFLLFFLFMMGAILVGFILLGLRPYLGYAFLLSLLLSLLLWKVRFTKKRVILLGTLYLLILFLANYIGLLDELTEYRAGFEDGGGGSTLGLDFSNPIMFIPNFILSVLGQLFGLYVTNPLAIVLFLIESMPFLFMLIYVIKNIKLADKFIRFLIIFFILYASVWLISNDNLGTAVRLRMFNYLSIYIIFFYILKVKNMALKNSEVVN